MLGRKDPPQGAEPPTTGSAAGPVSLLTVVGQSARMEGTCDIADSIQIECEIGGELRMGGKLVIGERGSGNVEIAATGRVSGNIKTDSLVISKGGCFNGNVSKINEEPAGHQAPVYLIEDKRAGQGVPR